MVAEATLSELSRRLRANPRHDALKNLERRLRGKPAPKRVLLDEERRQHLRALPPQTSTPAGSTGYGFMPLLAGHHAICRRDRSITICHLANIARELHAFRRRQAGSLCYDRIGLRKHFPLACRISRRVRPL